MFSLNRKVTEWLKLAHVPELARLTWDWMVISNSAV